MARAGASPTKGWGHQEGPQKRSLEYDAFFSSLTAVTWVEAGTIVSLVLGMVALTVVVLEIAFSALWNLNSNMDALMHGSLGKKERQNAEP